MAKTEPAIEFRDPPPPKSQVGGKWLTSLMPLLKAKGRWAMIKEYDRPEQAHDASSNLNQRKVRIPEPEHDWSFAARGCELFACYRGPKRPVVKRPRTVTKRR